MPRNFSFTAPKDFTAQKNNEFVIPLEIKNNGNLKIYDIAGNEKTEGTVGTGMIAKITDEYERNVFDLELIVKGDVSGDGDITITDLVKAKQHIAGVKELTGVYELAGDITDTGSISITDLVQISRDVAEIEEVK